MESERYYPRNLKENIKSWIEAEGYIIKRQDNIDLMNWAVVQFIIERLEAYDQRCKNNPGIFIGTKIKTLFGVKAISIAQIINQSIEEDVAYDERDLQSYLERNIGFMRSRVLRVCSCVRYYISRQLRHFLNIKKFEYKSKDLITLQTIASWGTYHLNDLMNIFNIIFSTEKKVYFDAIGENEYDEEVIITKGTDMFELFNMDAIEKIRFPILLTSHMHIEPNSLTEEKKEIHMKNSAGNKLTKYKFESYIMNNYILNQPNPAEEMKLYAFERSSMCSYTFLPDNEQPVLKINTYRMCSSH